MFGGFFGRSSGSTNNRFPAAESVGRGGGDEHYSSSLIEQELPWTAEGGDLHTNAALERSRTRGRRRAAAASAHAEHAGSSESDSSDSEGEIDVGFLLDDAQLLLRQSAIQHLVDDLLPNILQQREGRAAGAGFAGTAGGGAVGGGAGGGGDGGVGERDGVAGINSSGTLGELDSLILEADEHPSESDIRGIRMYGKSSSKRSRAGRSVRLSQSDGGGDGGGGDSRTLRVPTWRQIQYTLGQDRDRNTKLTALVLKRYVQEDLMWSAISLATLCLTIVLSVLLFFLIPLVLADLNHYHSGLVAITVFMVSFWTFKPFSIEASYTSLLTMLLLLVTGIASPAVVLSGGGQPSFWILVCGMFISGAIKDTTISARVSRLMLMLVPSKHLLLMVLIIFGAFMGILVPSGMVRVLLAAEVGDGVISQVCKHKKPSSSTRTAVYGSIFFSTLYCGYASLTGNVATLVTYNAISTVVEMNPDMYSLPSWGSWFLYMAPTCFVLEMLVVFAGVELLVGWRKDFMPGYKRVPFRSKPASDDTEMLAKSSTGDKSKTSKAGDAAMNESIKVSEILVALITLITAVLWAVESYIHLTTLWIALGSVLVLHMPVIGPSQFKLRTANVMLLILLAVIIGVGAAYQQTCTDKNGHAIVPCHISDMTPLRNQLETWMIKFVNLSSIRIVKLYLLFLFVTGAAWILAIGPTCGILIPMIVQIAGPDLGLPYFTASLTGPLAAMAVVLPAQAAPVLVAFLTGKVHKLPFILLVIWTGLTTIVFLAPLTIGWWEVVDNYF